MSLSKIAKCRTAYYMNKGILQQTGTRSYIQIARLDASIIASQQNFLLK
jgi:hypothetical protein